VYAVLQLVFNGWKTILKDLYKMISVIFSISLPLSCRGVLGTLYTIGRYEGITALYSGLGRLMSSLLNVLYVMLP
jgi:hypothetical protein